jgi:NAD(P)-dependent dehydrogenase (short-subunit alcohol dehydrogenase family)
MSLRAKGVIALVTVAAVWVGHGISTAEEHQPAVTDSTPPPAVLVTGASTGIGRSITEHLAANGVFVYAGARSQSDLDELDALDNVQSIRLDVTVDADIEAAVETVTKGGRGLHGLVNNAGVAIVGPLIEVEESDLDFLFDVNIYGPYRVTKAFAPLLIASEGRVTTISSISGILSGTLFGPYSMSKHAIEAYSDSLARELARFDVTVSVVEPGNYRSQIGATLKKRMEAQGIDPDDSRYTEDMRRMMSRMGSDPSDEADPIAVAEAVHHALFSDRPKMRYMVVPNQRQAEITIRKQIQELVELNQDHAHSYDRDQLVAMLDEALAELTEEAPE